MLLQLYTSLYNENSNEFINILQTYENNTKILFIRLMLDRGKIDFILPVIQSQLFTEYILIDDIYKLLSKKMSIDNFNKLHNNFNLTDTQKLVNNLSLSNFHIILYLYEQNIITDNIIQNNYCIQQGIISNDNLEFFIKYYSIDDLTDYNLGMICLFDSFKILKYLLSKIFDKTVTHIILNYYFKYDYVKIVLFLLDQELEFSNTIINHIYSIAIVKKDKKVINKLLDKKFVIKKYINEIVQYSTLNYQRMLNINSVVKHPKIEKLLLTYTLSLQKKNLNNDVIKLICSYL